jgi:hypothetical protein
MKKLVVALIGLSTIGTLAASLTTANAMPVQQPGVVSSNAEQVRYVCNAWGRCWWRPNYYVAPRYYGPRFYGPRFYGGPRYYGGWNRGWRHRW